MNLLSGKRVGAVNAGYEIVASIENAVKCNAEDCRWGVCIGVNKIGSWVTWEYDADRDDSYCMGHYFVFNADNEFVAWEDFLERCERVRKYAKSWAEVRAEKAYEEVQNE